MKAACAVILYSSYQGYDWTKLILTQFRKHFPDELLLAVDHNHLPAEKAYVEKLGGVVIDNPGPHFNHGAGINLAVEYCRQHNIDVLTHFEPDCLILGRHWYENLLMAIKQGNHMVGGPKSEQRHIHPCPSSWLVNEIKFTFDFYPKRDDVYHPRYYELYDEMNLITKHLAQSHWFIHWWDCGCKNWFEAACQNKAASVPIPDLVHLWMGSKRSSFEAARTQPFVWEMLGSAISDMLHV